MSGAERGAEAEAEAERPTAAVTAIATAIASAGAATGNEADSPAQKAVLRGAITSPRRRGRGQEGRTFVRGHLLWLVFSQ